MRYTCLVSFALGVGFASQLLADSPVQEDFTFPGIEITSSEIQSPDATHFALLNNVLSVYFVKVNNTFGLSVFENRMTHEKLYFADSNLFSITCKDKTLVSSRMKLIKGPEKIALPANPKLAKLSERFAGQALTAVFEDAESGLRVEWRALLRDHANALRQEIAVQSLNSVFVSHIEMINTSIPGAELKGYTDGAPIIAGNCFLGLEHPMAKNSVSTPGRGWSPSDMEARKIIKKVALSGSPLKVRFNYQSGNHRIDVSSVSLLSGDQMIAEDKHAGFSGIKTSRNEYELQIPAGMKEGELIVTLGGVVGENNSFGEMVVENGRLAEGQALVRCSLPRQFVLEPGQTWVVSTGIGVAPAGQMRRAFAYYLQRERAHPYRQYWHYNSWYDLNIGVNDNPDPLKRMTEEQCLQVVEAFDKNLYQKHGVGLNGYVWDDGWDDWNSLWQFHKGFPNGFSKLKDVAKQQGAGMGAWLSPWGGYGGSKNRRVRYGQEKGYEVNASGFALGGPKYYAAFRDTCIKMIRDYGQNYFKFDGIGGGMFATGAPASIASDLDNLVKLLQVLRRENPEVYINCTVGTWASPYWLFFADSIWRQGEDTSFAGKGNERERWITYKDKLVYDRFVSKSPFFPMNSLMYHGLVVGPRHNPAKMPTPEKNIESFKHEMRMMAGYSSGLGELYVTPSLMTDEAWKSMAESMKWSRANSAIVADTHWIGGNPGDNEVYGFAAWRPALGGVITLRNPDDKPQTYQLDVKSAFELLDKAPVQHTFVCPYPDQRLQKLETEPGKPATITLEPFEVLVFESRPTRK